MSAVSARMPPSPWLSARITMAMYLTETTMSSAQMMSDSTPSTLSCVARDGVRAEEALAHRVERAGADVAVDDADCGEGEREKRPRTDGARQEASNQPTGLADGLEVGSPLPAARV